MKKVIKISIFTFLLSCMFIFAGKTNEAYADFNIVLDPGHDSTHSGASGNGVREETINYKIAQYCFEELQKYTGYSNIYMTRNSEACPYPGTTSTQCNKKRVEFSRGVGANIYVSIHNNSSSSPAAKGASVYYPNQNFNPAVGIQGERLANVMLNRLIELGLENRGTHIRNSEDNTRYADGSLADYYGVIKNSKLAGFTAIIVEHAFVSNSSDVSNYLSSDAQLKLLGAADAVAIADYYGLKKKDSWDKNVSQAKLSTSFIYDNTRIKAFVSGISKAPAVNFAVWSSKNNQSDMKWYSASKDSSGNWFCEIPLSDFKESGNYNIHAYALDGENIFACSGTVYVSAPSAGSISAGGVDYSQGVFYVDINGVAANSPLSNVRVAVWTNEDQSDLHWITANNVSGNNYRAKINICDFSDSTKKYHLHAYATDMCGISGFLKSTNYSVEFPRATVSSAIDDNDIYYEVSVSDVVYAPMVTNMKVALWSAENGQDDIVWYTMTKTDNGWKYEGNVSEHITSIKVSAHVYAYLSNGTPIFVGVAEFFPNKTDRVNDINGVLTGESVLLWNGESMDVSLNCSDVSVSLSGDAAGMTTGDAADITVTGDSVAISPLDVITLRETIYSMKESTNLYSDVKSLLSVDGLGKYQSFYIAGAKFIVDESMYSYMINGQIKLKFILPEQFHEKDIVVFELNNIDGNYNLGKSYPVIIDSDGNCEIMADKLGDFVIATDFVEKNKLLGDLNYDGAVNLNDAKFLLRAAVGIISLTDNQREVADMNYDGKINLEDAKILLKKAVGIPY